MDATSQQIEQFARQHLQKYKVRGREASFCCPVHEDHNPSASLNIDSGLWTCHGCQEKGNIFQLAMAVLHCDFKEAAAVLLGTSSFPPARGGELNARTPRNDPAPEIVAVYPYTDDLGKLLFEKVRLEPKSFYIRRPDGQGGYTRNLGDTLRVLFNLPLVVRAGPEITILLVEGEKDALAGAALGFVATCNPFGAKEWQRSYSLSLRAKRVLVIADNDLEGITHAETARADLEEIAGQVVGAVLPGEGKDLSDWVEAGGTAERLRAWVESQFEKAPTEPAKEAPAVVSGVTQLDVPKVPEAAWCDLARDYRKALEGSTEASDSFHLATYNAIAGAVLGRLVYWRNPHPVYLNHYVALVGKSGRSRKGTAIDFGEILARAVNSELHWIRSINSAQGFVQTLVTLQEDQEQRKTISAILRFSELRSLIDVAGRAGTQDIIPEISNAFDCPPALERNTVKRSVVYGPVVSVLGGASPRWIENLKIDDLVGGLGNRFMWVIGSPKKRNAFPSEARLNLVIHDLAEVRKFWLQKGPTWIRWSPEAEAIFDPWYHGLDRYYEHLLFEVLADRMEIHCPKIGCLYAALDLRDKISVADIKSAIAYCEFLIASLAYIFADYGWAEGGKQDREIIEYVTRFAPNTVLKRKVQQQFSKWGGEIFNKRLQWLTGEDGPLRSEKVGRVTVLFLNPEKE